MRITKLRWYGLCCRGAMLSDTSYYLSAFLQLCYAMLCCAVLCCAMLCYAVLCCALLCYAVLCCAVLCCDVVCCAVLCHKSSQVPGSLLRDPGVFARPRSPLCGHRLSGSGLRAEPRGQVGAACVRVCACVLQWFPSKISDRLLLLLLLLLLLVVVVFLMLLLLLLCVCLCVVCR